MQFVFTVNTHPANKNIYSDVLNSTDFKNVTEGGQFFFLQQIFSRTKQQ